jgi:trk system potassium uptake protein TrkA
MIDQAECGVTMNVIVVGCGRIGAELAYGLFKRGHKVVVVDLNSDAFRNLPADFRGRTLEGDVLSPDVLLRAGIEHSDALAAVTPSDSINAVVAHTARAAFGVQQVVVRDFDPHKRSLHEAFGLQVVSPSVWGAQRIGELLSDEPLHTVFSAGNGEVEVYEFIVPAAWRDRKIKDIVYNSKCQLVAVTRAGRAQLPDPETVVQPDDVLHVSATQDGIEDLRKRLAAVKGA